jgi:hypothetical protein
MRHLLAIALAAICLPAASQQGCETVISMSRLQAVSISNNQTVQQHATNFCQEYSKNKGKSGGSNFGASYKFLSASFGSSNASVEAVASKYCSASDSSLAKTDSYQEYVETIAPGAFAAYDQCLRFTKSDLTFAVDLTMLFPREVSATLGFASQVSGNSQAKLRYESTSGTSCTWNGSPTQEFTLQHPSSASLKCTRTNISEPSGVKVIRTDSGAQQSMSFRWIAYDPSGQPVDSLLALQKRVDALNEQVQATSQTLQGFKDVKFYSVETSKQEHKNKVLDIKEKYAYCAVARVWPSHAIQPCGCQVTQDSGTRAWKLTMSVAEKVEGACACSATCTGLEQ